jgi:hypothetical protein
MASSGPITAPPPPVKNPKEEPKTDQQTVENAKKKLGSKDKKVNTSLQRPMQMTGISANNMEMARKAKENAKTGGSSYSFSFFKPNVKNQQRKRTTDINILEFREKMRR